ncbi:MULTISPECIES: orotidine-5'-phosphate decarboxylase [unclassified Treponema]|uniref:orotidine-5'-phosphate decarboxylase n=1 Tax=unclassified Treponema TaxID=2638727 RepID=UPI0020A24BE9|nr:MULTISPECIES: orotidine-5'-phosphate decarboxylase [unclassified Treponema]UTC67669.1 orotidine-5'-phosphate decarboxylase [Treponema sp. OMZ 789]UTC70397.1 orotidine-5'-phosphate decarboxylase [Treponema sp. OMZ 790]UTC73111.1 orotidine-5'-phosphate decarboxylase [Treponema sp. OMZ 791]
MNYIELLKTSAERTNNCACMGLDPIIEAIPQKTGNLKDDLISFFKELFEKMQEKDLVPSAFKPNIGYYSALDKPRKKDFLGSESLAEILSLIEKHFPGIPVILDSKRGDIARSSLNYAVEAFDCWKADAVTVSPYMGSDSILPFISEKYLDKGAYILNRTSNPGAKDFQNLKTVSDGKNAHELYIEVAEKIASYAKEFPGTGAVVGATGMEELKVIAEIYAKAGEVPMLIPGVGSQGGDAKTVISILQNAGCTLSLIRINSSSGLTHPWKKAPVPENYLELCINNIKKLLSETSIKK